jgi:arylsulfatase A-like enzyme
MDGGLQKKEGIPSFIVNFPGDHRGLNPSEITIAEMLKENGYATGCFGKWHLGDQPEFMPLAQGFDTYFGIPYSNDMWPGNKRGNPVTNRSPYEPLPIMLQNKAVAHVSDDYDQALLAEVITDEAIKFIRKNKKQPFFCFIPHSHVHNPRFARPKFLQRAEGNVNRAHVEEVDDSIGRVLNTLRSLKLDKNTLVMFTSDNGGAGGMSMGPLRGGKGGPKYEGHMRVPTLTWWPGTIQGGTTTNAIGVTTDLLPTFAKLTGSKIPNDRKIDGKIIDGILLGKAKAKSPHETLYYEKDGVRQGKWKLVRYKVKADRFAELYDLEKDLGERKDLSKQYPQKVKVLTEILDAHVEKIEEGIRTAGLVESPKPLLTDSKGIPTLTEYRNL